ncbi:MAG: hypothetical protein WBV85_07615 [Solirubrobacteraceae bacterium]
MNTTVKAIAVTALAVLACLLLPTTTLATNAYPQEPNLTFGSAGKGDGQFSTPTGIAVNETTGNVYVLDQEDNRVEEFTAEGEYIRQFDGSAAPTGNFERLTSIAIENANNTAKGDIYIADREHETVDIFDAEGKYLSNVDFCPEEVFPESKGPRVVATDGNGGVWIFAKVEVTSGKECEFNALGTLVKEVQVGSFWGSKEFAIDAAGGLTEVSNSSLRKYGPAGELLGEWGNIGGTKIGPFATAVTSDRSTGNLFVVTEASILEVYPLAELPEPVTSFGGAYFAGSSGNALESSEIAVNSTDGFVYVTQGSTDSVAVFKPVVAPDAATTAATGVSTSEASLSGTIERHALATTYHFEYGETAGYGASTASTSAIAEEETVGARISGLESATTYHYRLVAESGNGTIYGEDQTLTTQPTLARVEDRPPSVSNISRHGAVAAVTVNPEHSPTAVDVEYVADDAYEPGAKNPYAQGEASQTVQLAGARGDETVGQISLAPLQPATTYHYRVVTINAAGASYGADRTFTTTSPTVPVVSAGPAGNVSTTSAELSGAIDPQGLKTSYELEVGTSTSYEGATRFGDAGEGEAEEPIQVTLEYLVPGTTYHYRLVATNEDGTSYGPDQTFTTLGVSSPIAQPTAIPLIGVTPVSFPAEKTGSPAKAKNKKKAKAPKKRHKQAKHKNSKHKKKK